MSREDISTLYADDLAVTTNEENVRKPEDKICSHAEENRKLTEVNRKFTDENRKFTLEIRKLTDENRVLPFLMNQIMRKIEQLQDGRILVLLKLQIERTGADVRDLRKVLAENMQQIKNLTEMKRESESLQIIELVQQVREMKEEFRALRKSASQNESGRAPQLILEAVTKQLPSEKKEGEAENDEEYLVEASNAKESNLKISSLYPEADDVAKLKNFNEDNQIQADDRKVSKVTKQRPTEESVEDVQDDGESAGSCITNNTEEDHLKTRTLIPDTGDPKLANFAEEILSELTSGIVNKGAKQMPAEGKGKDAPENSVIITNNIESTNVKNASLSHKTEMKPKIAHFEEEHGGDVSKSYNDTETQQDIIFNQTDMEQDQKQDYVSIRENRQIPVVPESNNQSSSSLDLVGIEGYTENMQHDIRDIDRAQKQIKPDIVNNALAYASDGLRSLEKSLPMDPTGFQEKSKDNQEQQKSDSAVGVIACKEDSMVNSLKEGVQMTITNVTRLPKEGNQEKVQVYNVSNTDANLQVSTDDNFSEKPEINCIQNEQTAPFQNNKTLVKNLEENSTMCNVVSKNVIDNTQNDIGMPENVQETVKYRISNDCDVLPPKVPYNRYRFNINSSQIKGKCESPSKGARLKKDNENMPTIQQPNSQNDSENIGKQTFLNGDRTKQFHSKIPRYQVAKPGVTYPNEMDKNIHTNKDVFHDGFLNVRSTRKAQIPPNRQDYQCANDQNYHTSIRNVPQKKRDIVRASSAKAITRANYRKYEKIPDSLDVSIPQSRKHRVDHADQMFANRYRQSTTGEQHFSQFALQKENIGILKDKRRVVGNESEFFNESERHIFVEKRDHAERFQKRYRETGSERKHVSFQSDSNFEKSENSTQQRGINPNTSEAVVPQTEDFNALHRPSYFRSRKDMIGNPIASSTPVTQRLVSEPVAASKSEFNNESVNHTFVEKRDYANRFQNRRREMESESKDVSFDSDFKYRKFKSSYQQSRFINPNTSDAVVPQVEDFDALRQPTYYSSGKEMIGNPIASSTPITQKLVLDPVTTSTLKDRESLATDNSNQVVPLRSYDNGIKSDLGMDFDLKLKFAGLVFGKAVIGEVAFQLSRRVMKIVFQQNMTKFMKDLERDRYYGHIIQSMSYLIMKETLNADGTHDVLGELIYRDRLENLLKYLEKYGYNQKIHEEFARKMIGKYGTINYRLSRKLVDEYGLEDQEVLEALLHEIVADESELRNAMVLLNCLRAVVGWDGDHLFLT